MNLKDHLNSFVDFLRSSKKASATTIAYKKDIDQLLEYLNKAGKDNITSIATQDLNDFLALLASQNYTPKSISRKINSIKRGKSPQVGKAPI